MITSQRTTRGTDMLIECSADACLCGLFRKRPQKRPEEAGKGEVPLWRGNRRYMRRTDYFGPIADDDDVN